MFPRISTAFIGILLFLSITGCASKRSLPDVPTAIGENGLLVARLYVLGMRSMEDASINIDGKLMPSSLRDGYIAVALEPGEHKLNQIRAAGQLLANTMIEASSPFRQTKGGSAPTFIYIPGSSYTIHYTTLSVDRPFRIEPGKVTNLGLIVYLPMPDDPNRKRATINDAREFNVVNLDNSPEIRTFLETNYPDLVRSLKDRDITLAPGKYLDTKNLPALRRAIAFHESRGTNILSSPTKTVVYGRAGTIVALGKAADGVETSVDVLDTGTLADIVGATWNGQQFKFLTSNAELLSWDGTTIKRAELPYRVHPIRLQALGGTGLMVVDNHLRILTSRSPSDPWVKYDAAMTKEPRNDIGTAADSDGVYLSLGNRGMPEAMYYLAAGGSVPKPIPVPENRLGASNADFHFLVAREAGLFMMFNKPDYYFWSKAHQSWALLSQPKGKCKPMKIDSEGRNLTIECDGVDYRSGDSGASWKGPEI